jgi:CheY-like chemotaxis protein
MYFLQGVPSLLFFKKGILITFYIFIMDKPKKIMIVDDDPGIVDAIVILLEYEGYEVTSAYNGVAALTMQDLPDLLLLDIWMPGTDGREVCKQLKEKDNTRELPIIMISASKDIEDSALAAGADDFLAKPFEINDLIEKVRKYA